MMEPTVVETKAYVKCLHCSSGQFVIQHIIDDSQKLGKSVAWGPWSCEDCGKYCRGICNSYDVQIEKAPGQVRKAWVFLKHGDVVLMCEDQYYTETLNVDDRRTHFEERTCPVNYLGDVEEVLSLEHGETDVHGIFEFLGVIPAELLPIQGKFNPRYVPEHGCLLRRMLIEAEVELPKWLSEMKVNGRMELIGDQDRWEDLQGIALADRKLWDEMVNPELGETHQQVVERNVLDSFAKGTGKRLELPEGGFMLLGEGGPPPLGVH